MNEVKDRVLLKVAAELARCKHKETKYELFRIIKRKVNDVDEGDKGLALLGGEQLTRLNIPRL